MKKYKTSNTKTINVKDQLQRAIKNLCFLMDHFLY